jgi:hypothetical protein
MTRAIERGDCAMIVRISAFILSVFLCCDLLALTRLESNKKEKNEPELWFADDASSISIASEYPSYEDSVDNYASIFGKNRFMPVLRFDQYLNSHGSFLQLGFGFSIGMYKASGTPKVWEDDKSLDDLEEYKGSVNVILLPLTLYSDLRIFPMGPGFALNLSAGYRETYIEEVVEIADSKESKVPMAKGWNSLLALRLAFDIRVDGLTGESISSSRRLINLTGIFLSPYYEKTLNLKGDSLWGGRDIFPKKYVSDSFGLSFSFQFG